MYLFSLLQSCTLPTPLQPEFGSTRLLKVKKNVDRKVGAGNASLTRLSARLQTEGFICTNNKLIYSYAVACVVLALPQPNGNASV